MELNTLLPLLLGLAWLLPLASFALVVFFGPRMGKAGHCAGYVATGAIAAALVLSVIALGAWLWQHPLGAPAHQAEGAAPHAAAAAIAPIARDWYTLGEFGSLRLTIGYYIDALTIAMFTMVTFIATCIHVYSYGYMHEELEEVTDPLVTLSNGQSLKRRGRFYRFYQYLSLFCFSMLGLVISGNIAMVFVFWELVGICSYLLIGFYIERKSASTAANKAFIVNRVGDFGMVIGLMALWGALGTFNFGDLADAEGHVRPGIFSQVRPAANQHALTVPDGMVRMAAADRVEAIYRAAPSHEAAEQQIKDQLNTWRSEGLGYGLLVVAGLGIFCGCVGKSAQFPLHVWLPDAMEGPTPVSALIHAATMVAAGVYLVGRFYPVFTPEVLLVVACIGTITLFIAATIAIVATDIKRVLAYSTVSQLGYMMLALGAGGWLAGLFHLFTHAFFKALLFLGSGSVIHACHTNEMPQMGGLLKKMPWTAYTMLAGCLAIAGAGIPLVIGLSGYYSKDSILAQLFSFRTHTPLDGLFFYVATGGAAITSFYMFRMWYMTFLGHPKDHHVYDHAHESPKVMYVPLVALATLAVSVGWPILGLTKLLEQARPAGVAEGITRPVGVAEGITGAMLWPQVSMPAEHLSHADAIHVPVSWIAFLVALVGFSLATAMYVAHKPNPALLRRVFSPIYTLLWNKWYFDQAYWFLLVRPVLGLSALAAAVDRVVIDGVVNGLARLTRLAAGIDDWFDRLFVDGLVNLVGRVTFGLGLWLRNVQTGRLRQYVMLIVIGIVVLFLVASRFLGSAAAGF
jgi:NADH-quinone oxidoreductase subunit L